MSNTEIKEHDGLSLGAVKQIAKDMYKSARDRAYAQKLAPFDEGRVYSEFEQLVISTDKFPLFPDDMSEACCQRWMNASAQMRGFNPDFSYCPYCGVSFQKDEDQ